MSSSSSSSEEVVSASAAVNEETPVSLPRSNPPPLDRDNPDQDEQQQQQDDDDDDDDDDDEYLVSCQCESARLLSTLLRCLVMDKGRHGANLTLTHSMTHTSASMNTSTATGISTNNNNNNNHKKLLLPVTVVCHPTSLTFHVQGAARTSHASVDLPAGLFLDYRVRALSSCPTTCTTQQQQQQLQEPPCFSVNLTTLLDCLHVLGTHHLDRCKVGLAYNASQQVLHMELLMDDGLLSKSAIPGLDLVDPYHHTMGHTTTAAASRNATTCTRHHTTTPTTTATTTTTTYLATAFGSTPIAARLLVRSDLLREALHELESYQVHDPATSCTVAMSQKHGLELAVVGHACEVVLSLLPPQLPPCESQSQHGSPLCLLSLECPVPQAWTYPLYALWLGMRALETAHETCMSINQEGMIAIQHQVMPPDDVGDGTSPSFVDFLLMPLLQEDDDETDANEKVVASSLDTSNLNSPSAMSMSMRRNRASQNSHAIGDDDNGDPFKSDSNDSMEEEEEEEEMERPLSAAPLFGTVVPSGKNGGGAGAGRGGTTMDRAVRPRRRRRPAPTEVDMDDENETGEEYGSDDEPLNVTEATRRPLGRLSDDPPSSPELVYGDDC